MIKLDTEEMLWRMRHEPITGKELAERVGISPKSVYRIVGGKQQPKPETLKRICEVLRCTPNTLLIDDGESDGCSLIPDPYLFALHGVYLKDGLIDGITEIFNSVYGERVDDEVLGRRVEEWADFYASKINSMMLSFEILGVDGDALEQAMTKAVTTFFETINSYAGEFVRDANDGALIPAAPTA